MIGSDAIVLAPWLAFAAGVSVICLRLRISRHRRGRRLSLPIGDVRADTGCVTRR